MVNRKTNADVVGNAGSILIIRISNICTKIKAIPFNRIVGFVDFQRFVFNTMLLCNLLFQILAISKV